MFMQLMLHKFATKGKRKIEKVIGGTGRRGREAALMSLSSGAMAAILCAFALTSAALCHLFIASFSLLHFGNCFPFPSLVSLSHSRDISFDCMYFYFPILCN